MQSNSVITAAIKNILLVCVVTLILPSPGFGNENSILVITEKYRHLNESITTYIKPPFMVSIAPSCNLSFRFDNISNKYTFINHTKKQYLTVTPETLERLNSDLSSDLEELIPIIKTMLEMFPAPYVDELGNHLSRQIELAENDMDAYTKCLNPELHNRVRNQMVNFLLSKNEFSDTEYKDVIETRTGKVITIDNYACMLNYFEVNGEIVKTLCTRKFEELHIHQKDIEILKNAAKLLQVKDPLVTDSLNLRLFAEESLWHSSLINTDFIVMAVNSDDINIPTSKLVDLSYQKIEDTVFDLPTGYVSINFDDLVDQYKLIP